MQGIENLSDENIKILNEVKDKVVKYCRENSFKFDSPKLINKNATVEIIEIIVEPNK